MAKTTAATFTSRETSYTARFHNTDAALESQDKETETIHGKIILSGLHDTCILTKDTVIEIVQAEVSTSRLLPWQNSDMADPITNDMKSFEMTVPFWSGNGDEREPIKQRDDPTGRITLHDLTDGWQTAFNILKGLLGTRMSRTDLDLYGVIVNANNSFVPDEIFAVTTTSKGKFAQT